MAVTIERHCVAVLDSGLSPLQEALLNEPRRVRIASAPTGAGKTYAFQKALLADQRVLFIVPTRRLAQNIAASVISDLVQSAAWGVDKAQAKVSIWSSDQSAVLREQGVENIRGYRLREMRDLQPTQRGGEMIVAVPEVVSHLLHRGALDAGYASEGVFDLLTHFDHIVFDEFHTIEARGFGLAGLLAKLVSTPNDQRVGFGRAKVSLLSATPLDIEPVLQQMGVPCEQIALLNEQLVERGRALHGDVQLSLQSQTSLSELLGECVPLVREHIQAQGQVVLIYNALADLRRELPRLKQYLQQAGVQASQVLVVNSIDDSGRDSQLSLGFQVGRKKDPDDFSVIVATASIEMGVTLRAANLMLMEPGFAPMNFLQRYGRAARRGAQGAVVVRLGESVARERDWVRQLHQWYEQHEGQTVGIDVLSEVLSQSTQRRFSQPKSQHRVYGSLPTQALYSAGLYWLVLQEHRSNRGHRKVHLMAHQPKSCKWVYAKLSALKPLAADADYGPCAEQWRQLLMAQALCLRDIGAKVRVLEGDGRQLQVDRVWLARETDVLSLVPQLDEKGEEFFQLRGELDDELLEEKNRAKRKITVYFPHTQQICDLDNDEKLVKSWVRILKDQSSYETEDAWEQYPDAMLAAEQLVRLTGLVPGHDTDLSADVASMVI